MSIHVHLLKAEGLNAFLDLLVSWNEGMSKINLVLPLHIFLIFKKLGILIVIYFISFIQSSANAVFTFNES